ncbi:MAG: DUF4236 domain-containing protein [Chloroherpetonaceae bacterium]|nr:DUF4236 domain-containing protein [Chthonomonadaceae bacterium]MDW8206445.1 DUF4236 domain-containing protein [Chloroherpetonaceae bacterium]
MPLYFRKSIRLFGGLRLNLSSSGAGLSWGVRGFRLSVNPRGAYVTVGGNGIYYRQRIGGPDRRARSAQRASGNAVPVLEAQLPIPSAHVGQLVDSTSAATLERLNRSVHRFAYTNVVAVAGFLTAAVALITIHPVVAAAVGGFTLLLMYIAGQIDAQRRAFPLLFRLDSAARQQWAARSSALTALSKGARLWRITADVLVPEQARREKGARRVARRPVSLHQSPAPCIVSNYTPYCLDAGDKQLYFFPDRVYVYQRGTYGAITYADLSVTAGQERFVESVPPPADCQIVDYTWQYVRRDGGPDRRHAWNPQLPVVQYGTLALRSSTGLNLLLQVSPVEAAYRFAREFLGAQNLLPATVQRDPGHLQ